MPMPIETSEDIEIAASLWAVRERPLSPEDEASLNAWLDGDPRRRGALLRAQASWSALDRAKAFGPSVKWSGEGKPSRRAVLTAASVMSGLAAAGIGALFISQHRSETVTDTGEIRRLPMSDGSVAAINTESAIRVDMTERERRVDLVRGEVWFKVAKNRQRPFVVSAGDARVQAVGTAFSVRRRDGGADVLVTEGTVKVWREGDTEPAILLNAGDRTFVAQGGIVANHAPESIDNALAWRSGEIVLTGQSVAEAAAEYNRYNRVKIIIQNPELGSERLLGRFSTDDPEGFSLAVAHSFGAEMTKTDKAIFIGPEKN
jgi:transmembrane sensor